MRVRDEPFADPVSLGRRIAAIVLSGLATPFLVVASGLWLVLMRVLPAIARALMGFTVFLIIPAGVFVYHRDWTNAAQTAVMFLVVGTIAGWLCRVVNRAAGPIVWLR